MNKPAKIGCFFLLAMIVLSVLGALGIFIFADVIVEVAGKKVAEKMIPEITGTGFSIGNIKSSLFQGKLKLTDVVLQNPKGYSGQAMKAGTIYVELDVNSILTDKIVVRQILIDKLNVNYEQKLEGSNIDAIQKNIKERSKPEEKTDSQADMQPEKKKGKTWVIKNFDVKNASVSITVSLAQTVSTTVPLSDIHIENLGDSSEGKPLYELLPELFTLLLSDILKAVSSAGFGSGIVNDIQQTPTTVIKKIKDLF